jgi:hypothetical protein
LRKKRTGQKRIAHQVAAPAIGEDVSMMALPVDLGNIITQGHAGSSWDSTIAAHGKEMNSYAIPASIG